MDSGALVRQFKGEGFEMPSVVSLTADAYRMRDRRKRCKSEKRHSWPRLPAMNETLR